MRPVHPLVVTLRGRADMALGNARAYEVSGYRFEALAQRERAAAFKLAAEDADTVLGTQVDKRLPGAS